MRFRAFGDHAKFSGHVLDYLLREESVNSILLSMIHDPKLPSFLLRGGNPVSRIHELFTCTVDAAGKPLFVAARRPGFHLVVYGDVDPQVVHCAAKGIIEHNIDPKGIIGPRRLAEAFSETYAEVSGRLATVEMEQIIYELKTVSPYKRNGGSLRVAAPSDSPRLVEWFHAFHHDIRSPREPAHVRDRVLGMIARKTAYIWEVDAKPVSLAIHSRSTRNGAAVSGVYTPPESRGRGYATACVSALSQRLLDAGFTQCCLYTDASFPTSNRIYRRIGYREIASSIVFRFARKTEVDT